MFSKNLTPIVEVASVRVIFKAYLVSGGVRASLGVYGEVGLLFVAGEEEEEKVRLKFI